VTIGLRPARVELDFGLTPNRAGYSPDRRL